MKKFNITLSKIKYGWMRISLFQNEQHITSINGSGVYNPFWDVDKLFLALRGRKNFIWEIDQEGTIAYLKIKNLGKTVKITFENEKECVEKIFFFSKKQFLNELKKELNVFRKKEYKEINNIFYNFYFREIK